MPISVTRFISFFHLHIELFYFLLFSLLSGAELATASHFGNCLFTQSAASFAI